MGTEDTSGDKAGSISDLENKIINQIEYYFGDFNLAKDKFLKEQIKLDDGWIPLETMIKFNRLQKLSVDFGVITEALKKSPNQLMEVSEDGTKIRRCADKPLPEHSADHRSEINDRTIYAKGFPEKASLDEIIEFFKDFGNVESVYMRRRVNKVFKGSVFATFVNKEEAEKFLKKENVKYKSTELLRETKPAYVQRKQILFEQKQKEIEKKKQLKEKEAKEEELETQVDSEISEGDIVRGCILKLSGLSEVTMWEDIKEVLGPHETIAYVDYSKGKPEAYVRFERPVASAVLEKVSTEDNGERKIMICNQQATAVFLEGDDELNYWKRLLKAKSLAKQKFNNRKGGQNRSRHSRGGSHHRFGKRDRRQADRESQGTEGRSSKQVKVVDTANSSAEQNKDVETQEPPAKKRKPELSTETSE